MQQQQPRTPQYRAVLYFLSFLCSLLACASYLQGSGFPLLRVVLLVGLALGGRLFTGH